MNGTIGNMVWMAFWAMLGLLSVVMVCLGAWWDILMFIACLCFVRAYYKDGDSDTESVESYLKRKIRAGKEK